MTQPERIWRCSCGAAHFLTIRVWDDGDPPIFILEGSFRGSFRHRLRQAVRHVLGRGHGDSWLELCLDDAMVREIRDHLNSLLPQNVHISFANTNTSTVASTIDIDAVQRGLVAKRRREGRPPGSVL